MKLHVPKTTDIEKQACRKYLDKQIDILDEVCSKVNIEGNTAYLKNEEKLENLRYAFSTKIADSLACGRPFLVYASDDFPFVKYLVKNDVAHIARNEKEIYKVLSRIKKDLEFRNKYIIRAQALAQKNHSLDIQCQYVEAVLNRLL